MHKTDSSSLAQRRALLMSALGSGLLIGGLGWSELARAGLFGRRPRKLGPDESIFEMEGRVLVNGQPARRDRRILASDRIEVGPGGHIVYAVGDNAYMLRERSILEMDGKDLITSGLRLISGAVLGVFGKRQRSLPLTTRAATIGIRGTALYTAVMPDMSYVCTCYGQVDMQSTARPDATESVSTRYHDAPRYILDNPGGGPAILPAPVIDHTDMELITLEALVGREVPFAAPAPPIGSRRGY